MDQPRSGAPVGRNLAELADGLDLRSVISAALVAKPIDEQSLRRGVWTYVGAERGAGSSPGHVIARLSELVEAADVTPLATHHEIIRRVILWSVEAYFGHLGGSDVAPSGGAGDALSPANPSG
jgi:hypothetical protein